MGSHVLDTESREQEIDFVMRKNPVVMEAVDCLPCWSWQRSDIFLRVDFFALHIKS